MTSRVIVVYYSQEKWEEKRQDKSYHRPRLHKKLSIRKEDLRGTEPLQNVYIMTLR